jgi:hypothetical protein
MANKKIFLIGLAAACFCTGSARAQITAGAEGAAVRATSLDRLEAVSERLSDASRSDVGGAAAALDGVYSGSAMERSVPGGGSQVAAGDASLSSTAQAVKMAAGTVRLVKPNPPEADTTQPDPPAADKPKTDGDKPKQPPFGQQLLAGCIGMLLMMLFIFALL